MPDRYHAVLVLAAGVVLSACTPSEPAPVSPVTSATALPAAMQATPVAGSRHVPADRVLLDFRGKWWDAPEVPEAERQRIAKLLGPAASGEAQVTSSVDGAFTKAGAQERAVMVVPGGASTIVPFPQPATLAILEDDRVVARHAFDADDPSWQWIRAVADTDGDTIDELLLSSGHIQMGEQATSLLVASMAGGRYRAGTTFAKVAYSDCGAHDDRSRGRVEAAVIAIEGGKLVEHRHRAACATKPNRQGDYPDPAPGDYRPVP